MFYFVSKRITSLCMMIGSDVHPRLMRGRHRNVAAVAQNIVVNNDQNAAKATTMTTSFTFLRSTVVRIIKISHRWVSLLKSTFIVIFHLTDRNVALKKVFFFRYLPSSFALDLRWKKTLNFSIIGDTFVFFYSKNKWTMGYT